MTAREKDAVSDTDEAVGQWRAGSRRMRDAHEARNAATDRPVRVRPVAVEAYAPGSIGNLGPGLDVLGAAVTGAGDRVEARWVDDAGGDRESGVTAQLTSDPPFVRIDAPGHPSLPRDAARHACGIAAMAVLRAVARRGSGVLSVHGARGMVSDAHSNTQANTHSNTQAPRGVALRVHKGLPLSGGQGGSAASAVAAAVAVHALLGEPLSDLELLAACLEAEEAVAGRHLDNLAPSLLGGVAVIRSLDPIDVAAVPVAQAPWFALVRPDIAVRTADARAVLPQFVPRALLIAQLGEVAALVTALGTGDLALLGRALTDHYAEPVRATAVPGFREAMAAARAAGAVGGSLSGSGPTTFAVCADEATASAAALAMRDAFREAGVESTYRAATLDTTGARWRTI